MAVELPLEAIVQHFNINCGASGDWLDSLVISVHPDRSQIAIARNKEIAVFSLLPDVSPASPSPSHPPSSSRPVPPASRRSCGITLDDAVTDMLWVTYLQHSDGRASSSGTDPQLHGHSQHPPSDTRSARSTSDGGEGAPSTLSSSTAQPRCYSHASQQQQQQQQYSFVTRHDAAGHSDCCLLVGTSTGYMHILDGRSTPLFRQRVRETAVQRIRARVYGMGLQQGEYQEDITISFADCVVRLTAWDLRAVLRGCAAVQAATAAGDGSSGTAPRLAPLPLQVWELPRGVKARSDGLVIGHRPRDLYSLLQGIGSNKGGNSDFGDQKLVIVTAGASPSVVALEVDEHLRRSTLAAIAGIATSLSSNVWGLARTARQQVAAGPRAMLVSGLKTFIPASLLTSGIMSNRPLAAFDDLKSSAAPVPEPSAVWRTLRDDGRSVTCLSAAPRGSLLATADTTGRVLLLDGAGLAVLRMWKGYRDAQCGWLEVPTSELQKAFGPKHAQAGTSDGPGGTGSGTGSEIDLSPALKRHDARATAASPGSTDEGRRTGGSGTAAAAQAVQAAVGSCTLVLVMYAPRRQTLEMWLVPYGRRLRSMQVRGRCRLMQLPYEFSRDWRGAAAAGSGRCGCVLLNAASGLLVDVGNLLLLPSLSQQS